MLGRLIPDYMFDDIYSIDLDIFKGYGIKGLILDIDNTLVSYSTPDPTDRVLDWIKRITDMGITISFVSNNNQNRVERFNKTLGFHAIPKAGKPSKRSVINAIDKMKLLKDNVMLIGDQIFTDCLAAKNAGIKVIVVNPVEKREDIFFLLKRIGEKPFKIAYQFRTKKKQNQNI
ncbi:MAG: YqeG family HAD IIIA-type phosphatase [Eubacteriales bacterium]